MDIFLRFKNREIAKEYEIEAKSHQCILRTNALKNLLFFLVIENIARYITFRMYDCNISWINMNAIDSIVYHIFLLLIFIGGLIYGYAKTKRSSQFTSKYYDALFLLCLSGVLYFDIYTTYITKKANILFIQNIDYVLIGFKCLWKLVVGSNFLNNTFIKLIYIIEIFIINCVIIQFLLYNDLNYSYDYGYGIYILICIVIEYIFILIILYNHQKLTRLLFINRYEDMQNAKTMTLILNEIPEDIIILNTKLQIKYISKKLNNIHGLNNNNEKLHEWLSSIKDVKIRKEISHDIGTKSCKKSCTCSIMQYASGNGIDLLDDEQKLIKNYTHSIYLLKNNEELNNDISLYDLCKDGNSKAPNLFELLKSNKMNNDTDFFILDCKYISSNQADIKRIELKISETTFHQEECLILIIKDTTQRDIIARLEDNNIYKERLLASVSHELRTPLNGNLVMIESAIHDRHIDENVKSKYLIPAFRSGKFLMNIINDILDFSQINANSLRLIFTIKDIKETIMQAINLIELQAKKKNIELYVDIKDNVPNKFCTDHNRLTQIILNLLSNSLKFTFKGYIKIIVIQKEADILEITVEDTGIGIKEENFKDLFKAFTKINNGDKFQMNPAGIGLGLSISNTLAKLLGPTTNSNNKGLNVISEINKGTKFYFEIEDKIPNSLPMLSSTPKINVSQAFSPKMSSPMIISPNDSSCFICNEDENISCRSFVQSTCHVSMNDPLYKFKSRGFYGGTKESSKKSKFSEEYAVACHALHKQYPFSDTQVPIKKSSLCTCPKILIVDDDGFNHMAMENLMNKLNYSYATAYNGEIAIETILKRENIRCSSECQTFKLIFMDCNMPIMTGFEATIKLKEMMKFGDIRDIIIIGCTSYSGQEKILECLESGMDDVISKPLSINKLQEVLEKFGFQK